MAGLFLYLCIFYRGVGTGHEHATTQSIYSSALGQPRLTKPTLGLAGALADMLAGEPDEWS